jgi:hypothetical protein
MAALYRNPKTITLPQARNNEKKHTHFSSHTNFNSKTFGFSGFATAGRHVATGGFVFRTHGSAAVPFILRSCDTNPDMLVFNGASTREGSWVRAKLFMKNIQHDQLYSL